MALGDGTQWDETNPQQTTLANTIDSYDRDLRIGVRLRMGNEHVWPSSQTGSGQAGQHLFITMQAQTSVPALTGSQVGVVYIDTNNNLIYNNGTSVKLTNNGALNMVYVKVSNTQLSGTAGGAATTGSWQTGVLNTKDSDLSGIATLTSNQLTLPSGTYKVNASSTFHQTSQSQIRLQNITGSSTLLPGTSVISSSSNVSVSSVITGVIVLATTSTLSLQYQVAATTNTNDLGEPSSFGTEVYSMAEFEKIA